MGMILETLLVKLAADGQEYFDTLDDTANATDKWQDQIVSGMGAAGKAIVIGGAAMIAAGFAAVSAAAVKGVESTVSWANEIDNMGDVLGTSAEESSALAVAIKGVGGNVEAITGQMTFMTRGLTDAEGKIGPTGLALQSLGVNFMDANGNMLPTTDILTSVADKLAVMPDGLEKTALMTDLFGKSGKDLSDTMTALANGGLTEADALAKQIGLSMGDDAAAGAVALGWQWEKLNMIGQGFWVMIGTQLLPIIAPLIEQFMVLAIQALPYVSAAIADAAVWVSAFVTQVITWIPQAIAWFQGIVTFLMENQGVIVGILAALGAAVMTFVVTSVVPAVLAFIAAAAPVFLTLAAIGVAAYLLYTAWTQNWGGIQQKVTAALVFIQALIATALATIQAWWAEHGAQVIATVTKLWNTVYTTVSTFLTDASTFISTTLANIKAWWDAHGTEVIATVTNLWTTISTTVISFLTTVSTFISDRLAVLATWWDAHGQSVITIVSTLATWIATAIGAALAAIYLVVSTVLTAISAFWTEHGATITTIVTALWEGVQKLFNGFFEAAGLALDAFAALFEGDWDTFGLKLQEAWKTIWDTIVSVLNGLWETISPILSSALTSVQTAFTDIDWGGIGQSIIDGIKEGLMAAAEALAQAAADAAAAALEAAKQALGISSPSTEFAYLGEMSIAGWINPLEAGKQTIADATAGIATAQVDSVSDVVNNNQNQARSMEINVSPQYYQGSEPTLMQELSQLTMLYGAA